MRRLLPILMVFLFMTLILGVSAALAAPTAQDEPNVPAGAQIYDNWMTATGQNAPAGNHPIWSRQTNNTTSGPDTWRCVTCHGWDYQGKDGAYRAGSAYTGFPGVYAAVQQMSEEEIIGVLKGDSDVEHNFSLILDDAALANVAAFLKYGLVDDTQFIDLTTLKVIQGDTARGKDLYTRGCAKCHKDDGSGQAIRYEGRDFSLVTLANTDPWRFLHKSRYGTPGNPMQSIGFDLAWSAQDGRDVLAYIQSLPDPKAKNTPEPALENRPPEAPKPTGPARNWFSGILTALGAMITGLGFNLLFFAVLIAVIFLLVWAIRGRKK